MRKVHDPAHITRSMMGMLDPFSTEQREAILTTLRRHHEELESSDTVVEMATAGSKPQRRAG